MRPDRCDACSFLRSSLLTDAALEGTAQLIEVVPKPRTVSEVRNRPALPAPAPRQLQVWETARNPGLDQNPRVRSSNEGSRRNGSPAHRSQNAPAPTRDRKVGRDENCGLHIRSHAGYWGYDCR